MKTGKRLNLNRKFIIISILSALISVFVLISVQDWILKDYKKETNLTTEGALLSGVVANEKIAPEQKSETDAQKQILVSGLTSFCVFLFLNHNYTLFSIYSIQLIP